MLRIMPGDVTHLLSAIDAGDPKAAEELLPLVYEELRRLAAQKMARELPGQTLQATALVHDAWLRLGGKENQSWDNRGHFFAAAAEAMRRILIDRARKRALRRKHELDEGAGLEPLNIVQTASDNELLAVNDALDRLAQFDPQAASLVKLRYFVGMNMTEAADSLNLPQRSAERLWNYARSWLRTEIHGT